MNQANTGHSKARSKKKSYKRRARNILIHKPMQREFSMVLIALVMISTFAVGFVIHSTVREMAMGGTYHFGKVSLYDVLSDMSYQLVVRVSIILFITIVIIGLYGIFFLHRVAGPVYRFRQTFLRLNDGELPHLIKLREGDFFEETAVEINRLLKRLKHDREKALSVKEKLSKSGNSPSPELLQEIQKLTENDYKEE